MLLWKPSKTKNSEAPLDQDRDIKSRDDVLTLLVHLGYLAYDSATKAVFIPNEEVRQEFLLAVRNGRHKEVPRLIRNSDRLLEQTLNMEETAVAEAIEETHL